MSKWSDWKCGAITEQDYRIECMIEAAQDEEDEEREDEDDE